MRSLYRRICNNADEVETLVARFEVYFKVFVRRSFNGIVFVFGQIFLKIFYYSQPLGVVEYILATKNGISIVVEQEYAERTIVQVRTPRTLRTVASASRNRNRARAGVPNRFDTIGNAVPFTRSKRSAGPPA